jgi:cell division protein ZapA
MNDVKLSLGKRTYTLACAEGEEDHLRHLAGMVDARLAAIGADLMGQTEAKNLLIAALILADEVHEAKRATPTSSDRDDSLADLLETLAERLEKSAAKLERTSQGA